MVDHVWITTPSKRVGNPLRDDCPPGYVAETTGGSQLPAMPHSAGRQPGRSPFRSCRNSRTMS